LGGRGAHGANVGECVPCGLARIDRQMPWETFQVKGSILLGRVSLCVCVRACVCVLVLAV
jgi:hypothetical protein